VAACVPRSFGQLVCAGDGDCTARGQTCSELDTIGGVLTPVCGHPPSGVGALNDVCTGSALENPNQCASGFCDDAQDGRCVDTCVTDADCGGTMTCTDSHLGNVVGRWCAEPCTTMAGCGFDAANPDSRICKRRCDDADPVVAARGFELACTPPVGTRNANSVLAVSIRGCTASSQCLGGEVCSGNPGVCVETAVLCKSGFSVSTGTPSVSYCSQPCIADSDCGGGLVCGFNSRTTCGGVEDAFSYCRRP
jgi:hypothetical protein